ncbi:MAG TPA: pyruvate kinase [Candidatus Absconditabacterales bacterium]|nr:pyruvate kinase [Candidatus Absconditabacterales bacterium]HMT27224.1 pyruvate kinase [Candidatus Absconditabacterales bacterium]
MYQHTKVVGTIGPASQSKEMLTKLINTGLTAIRMNFSHGDHEYHGKTIDLVREIEKEMGIHIPIILDTKGPEIRTGKLKDGKPVQLVSGNTIAVTPEEILGDETRISLTYKSILRDMKPGMMIMIADGLLRLQVKEVVGQDLICTIMNSGTLGEKKNVNLPGVVVDLPAMSDQDKKDLIFSCEKKVDFIAASFIRKPSDIREIRAHLQANGGKQIKIISKIENQEGIDNFDEILKETDGVMVARGDLGVDIPLEKIPLVQKMMIKKSNKAGKPVITATQMLESMIKNPRPTRAEVTDIANAILDGTDAVMLSGETAGGDHPLESVQTMADVIREIDAHIAATYQVSLMADDRTDLQSQLKITHSIARGAVQTAYAIGADAIFAASIAGTTIRAIREYNAGLCPVFVYTSDEVTARQSFLLKSVVGVSVGTATSDEELYSIAKNIATTHIQKKSGYMVVVGGGSVGNVGKTDFTKVIEF